MSSPQATLGGQVKTPVDFGEHEQLSIFSPFSLRTRHLLNMAAGTFTSFSLQTLTWTLLCILFVIANTATSLH